MHKNAKIDTPQKLIAANVPPVAQTDTENMPIFLTYFLGKEN
jgi:hypothetical protein